MKGSSATQPVAERFDRWFDEHPRIYQSILNALEGLIPQKERSIEIGAETGRFAIPLQMMAGIEPSPEMTKIAKGRGLEAIMGAGECLPLQDMRFGCVLFVFGSFFIEDVGRTISEAFRVLRPGGVLIFTVIEMDSPLGQELVNDAESRLFFESARFRGDVTLKKELRDAGFARIEVVQVVFEDYGEKASGMSVIRAHKPATRQG
ncbi:MAG: class I SAM-dependent methyltransferase [Methanomicrobiales archaeon]|nr:class I SAM-dependent methyltransferase [Methanomicrobiales archaeon]